MSSPSSGARGGACCVEGPPLTRSPLPAAPSSHPLQNCSFRTISDLLSTPSRLLSGLPSHPHSRPYSVRLPIPSPVFFRSAPPPSHFQCPAVLGDLRPPVRHLRPDMYATMRTFKRFLLVCFLLVFTLLWARGHAMLTGAHVRRPMFMFGGSACGSSHRRGARISSARIDARVNKHARYPVGPPRVPSIPFVLRGRRRGSLAAAGVRGVRVGGTPGWEGLVDE